MLRTGDFHEEKPAPLGFCVGGGGQPRSKSLFTDHLTFPENVLQEELKSYIWTPDWARNSSPRAAATAPGSMGLL